MLDFLRDQIWVFIGVIIAVLALILAYIGRDKINKTIKKVWYIVTVWVSRYRWYLTALLVVCLIIAILCIVISPGPQSPVGRPPGTYQTFSIGKDYYHASGKMGDIGDIDIARGAEIDRFTYEALGRGPHEWDWKCRDGKPNSEPAQFAGVMYLDPPNNWGANPGFDLRGNRRVLMWEARSVTGAVIVEFIIGGVDWVWDEKQECRKISPLCPDSMPRTVVGRATLTENWQSFSYDLTKVKEEYFKNLIGGFSWVITWGSNGVLLNQDRTGPVQSKTFIIEIHNIRYER